MSTARGDEGHDTLASILDWLPGECLYGWCARHFRAHGIRTESTSLALFANARAHRHRCLPSGLDRFVEVTDGLLGSAEDVLIHRMPACSYLPFLDATKRAEAIAAACRSNGTSLLEVLARFTGHSGPLLDLRHCPDCLAADWRTHHQCLRRLEHQLPGVWYCSSHGRVLQVELNCAAGWVEPGHGEDASLESARLPEPCNERERRALAMCSALALAISQSTRIDSKALAVDSIHHLAEIGVSSERRLNSARLDEWFSLSPIGQWLARSNVLRSQAKGWIAGLLKGTSTPTALKWTLLWCAIWDDTPAEEAVRAFVEVAARKQQYVTSMLGRQLANSWEVHRPRARRGNPAFASGLLLTGDVGDLSSGIALATQEAALARFDDARLAVLVRREDRVARYADIRRRFDEHLTKHPGSTLEALEQAHPEEVKWLQRHRRQHWETLRVEFGVKASSQLRMFTRSGAFVVQ